MSTTTTTRPCHHLRCQQCRGEGIRPPRRNETEGLESGAPRSHSLDALRHTRNVRHTRNEEKVVVVGTRRGLPPTPTHFRLPSLATKIPFLAARCCRRRRRRRRCRTPGAPSRELRAERRRQREFFPPGFAAPPRSSIVVRARSLHRRRYRSISGRSPPSRRESRRAPRARTRTRGEIPLSSRRPALASFIPPYRRAREAGRVANLGPRGPITPPPSPYVGNFRRKRLNTFRSDMPVVRNARKIAEKKSPFRNTPVTPTLEKERSNIDIVF